MEKAQPFNAARDLFFYLYIVAFVSAALLLLLQGKPGSFISLNRIHTSKLDLFFRLYTNLGDGFFAISLSLVLYYIARRKQQAITIIMSYALTGIAVQIIKPIFASPRPATFFAPRQFSFFINDIIHNGFASFPSGHTATAFAIATVLALYASKLWQSIVLLTLAVLAGFSRIYLSQHFLTDVLAGSYLGVVGALLCHRWCCSIKIKWLAGKS